MTAAKIQRCWRYYKGGCKNEATHSEQFGCRILFYCDDPGCKPIRRPTKGSRCSNS